MERLIETASRDLAKYEALRRLREELPAFAAILSPRNLRKAYRGDADFRLHLMQLLRLYEEHKDALDAFWRTHA